MVVKAEAAFGLLSDYETRIFLNELNGLDVGGNIIGPVPYEVAVTSELNEVAVDSETNELVIIT